MPQGEVAASILMKGVVLPAQVRFRNVDVVRGGPRLAGVATYHGWSLTLPKRGRESKSMFPQAGWRTLVTPR